MTPATPTVEALMTAQPVTVDPEDSLDHVLRLLCRYPFRHLPVVRHNRLVGVLSDRDVCLATGWLEGRSAAVPSAPGTVGDVMRAAVEVVGPHALASEAARQMRRARVGALPVVHEDDLVGIITATDLLRDLRERCHLAPNSPGCAGPLAELMRTDLLTVTPESTIDHAVHLAYQRGVRHLPVLQGEELVGIVSDRDLRRSMAAEALAEATAEVEGHGTPPPRTVEQDMTRGLLVLPPDASIASAAHALAENRIGALPVVEEGRLVGIVCESDLLERYLEVVTA